MLDLNVLLDNKFYCEYKSIIEEFEIYQKQTLPLSAAENIISEFAKEPLAYGLQERYILGGHLNYIEEENMIGSNKLLPFYKIINQQCKELFGATYTDCRSLSGMNALQNILLTLVESGDEVLLLSPESGGHAAIPNILKKLQVNFIDIPYDYQALQINYENANKILQSRNIKFVLIAPTDILYLPDMSKFDFKSDTILIYDASQVLAFYIQKKENNPLLLSCPVILMGGTHKTVPGVAKALIMTNNDVLAWKIDKTINPLYLRNTHVQNVASLILTLIEMEYFSDEYCRKMKENSNLLGERLEQLDFDCLYNGKLYSETHQVFLHLKENERDAFYHNAMLTGVSLNKKNKKLFKGSGIRLGVQEITRYGWGKSEIDEVTDILVALYQEDMQLAKLKMNILCQKKNIKYTFKEKKV